MRYRVWIFYAFEVMPILLLVLQKPLGTYGKELARKSNINLENNIHVTAVKCVEHDRSFARFPYCRLKAVNRNMKTLSLRVQLLKPPVTKSNVRITMYKHANGYKPFVVNVTMDICKYFAGSRNRALDWLYNPFVKYTNINHTCPYVDDMIVEKLPLNSIKLPSLFPDGDYRWDFMVDAFNVPRATVMLYVTIKEKLL